MEHLLLTIIGILLLIIFALLAKVYFLRKSAQEIAEAFRDRLVADTNTLIDISTRDPYMRKLAAEINVQLRLLRQQRHKYLSGDRELKDAVTNISHDLRTPPDRDLRLYGSPAKGRNQRERFPIFISD